MIEEKDILSLNYLKKQTYTGSFRGMRYLLRKKGDEKAGDVQLEAVVWPEPLNLEHTNDVYIQNKNFTFSEGGRNDAIKWLNEIYLSAFRKS